MSKETEVLITEATPLGQPAKSESWKSGLFSCFKYGCFHPALCCACCFPAMLMGQLLTRMKMTWLGDPSPVSASEAYKKTFRIVVTIAICNYVIYSVLYCPLTLPETTDTGDIVLVPNEDCPIWKNKISGAISSLFGLYTFIVMIRLRKAIRAKYSIPEENCTGCEDCCCVFFCGCCSAVQMAHQTADYDEVRALCCSDTGLPPSVDVTFAQAVIV